MLKIVQLGVGQHSKRFHLPALARYVEKNPGEIELVGLCDLRREVAMEMAAQFGFARVYTDVNEMLATERPDGFIAITPWEITADIASRSIAAGIPVLMEKPMGQTLEQAQQVVALAKKHHARVMVSMNRRFSPSICSLLEHKPDRPSNYLRASILRHARDESFFWTTAIHPIDAMRHIAGDVREHSVEVRVVNGVCWFYVHMVFASGAKGLLEVLPTVGMDEETYELFGPNYRVKAIWGGAVQCWEDRKLVFSDHPGAGEPECVTNGAYGETVEFIAALKEKRAFRSSLTDTMPSMELALSMHAAGIKATT